MTKINVKLTIGECQIIETLLQHKIWIIENSAYQYKQENEFRKLHEIFQTVLKYDELGQISDWVGDPQKEY